MLGKITAAAVIAFWAAMMSALVRLEFFPQSSGLGDVPPEVVLHKIFHHEEDTRLNVSYQGQAIGFCKVEINPVLSPGNPLDKSPATKTTAYRVRSELTLTLTLLGTPSRLRLVGDSLFDEHYQLESFHLKTSIGDGTIDVRGDAASKKVHVDYAVGELREKRDFDFAQVQGAGLASAMGLPGLPSFAGGPLGLGPAGPAGPAGPPSTLIYLADLPVGDAILRKNYLVESKLDKNMWAKMWVSQRGEVLKVETSFGLTMLADVLSDQSVSPHGRRKAGP